MGDEIVIENLSRTFRGPAGPVHAVRGIDMRIARGETVALLGPNGAGKTTTIDMLLGLLRPDGGSVTVFGRPPREAVDAGLIGGMLQNGALTEGLTGRELVTMLAGLYPEALPVEEAVQAAGAESFADQRTNKLSGGQAQRIRFAMALVANPELMVLDEPTVALDVEGRRDFWQRMRSYAAGGRTVLFATHYIEEADAYADRAILIAHGRIVADGPTTEIKARVGARTIRATLPDVELDELGAVPGVNQVERRGEAVVLRCADSDQAIRQLIELYPRLRDIEISGAALEDAFMELTAEADDEEVPVA